MGIEKKIEKLISKEIENLGYILDCVEILKEDSEDVLRVTIDKQGYINIDDCEKVSRAIDPIFDEIDFIDGAYVLEVSSKEKGEINDGQ